MSCSEVVWQLFFVEESNLLVFCRFYTRSYGRELKITVNNLKVKLQENDKILKALKKMLLVVEQTCQRAANGKIAYTEVRITGACIAYSNDLHLFTNLKRIHNECVVVETGAHFEKSLYKRGLSLLTQSRVLLTDILL